MTKDHGVSKQRYEAQQMRRFIFELPVGSTKALGLEALDAADLVDAVDIDKLPDGIVTGTNLLQFPANASAELRSSVALSLLAAQRVATNDPVVQTPDQWIQRHNTVLQNLNWLLEGGGFVDAKYDSINVAVHKAIIPFLTAALGPAAAAATLITTALKQLGEMDASAPWITLFERESRRFEVSEFQFGVVETTGTNTRLHMAAARFDASYGRTQVLFFKVKDEDAKFKAARSTMLADSSLLAAMNDDLKSKLEGHAKNYIRKLKIGG